MKKILLIEDDLHMCELLTDYMNCKGYHIRSVYKELHADRETGC